jgi:hypothetical protein
MDTDEPQLYQFSTPQSSNSFKRPRRSLQSSTPLSSVSESVTPSPRVSGQFNFNPQVVDHINALKHLDDHQILLLLQAARNGGQYTRDAVGAYAHPFWRRQIVNVDARKPCLILLERTVKPSA